MLLLISDAIKSTGEVINIRPKETHISTALFIRRISQLTGEAYSKDTGKLVATAASVYLNVDTKKERSEAKAAKE